MKKRRISTNTNMNRNTTIKSWLIMTNTNMNKNMKTRRRKRGGRAQQIQIIVNE